MHSSIRALAVVALFVAGCTQSVTALETIDAASTDAATIVEPDGGMIANLCAHPELFDGMVVELTVTGIQRTAPSCTAVFCGSDGGVPACCNDCDAYWVLPCASGGTLAFVQGLYGFSCYGTECALSCDPMLLPSDVVSFHGTVHAGGPPTPCCAPTRFGVPGARATFDVIDYTVTSLPDS